MEQSLLPTRVLDLAQLAQTNKVFLYLPPANERGTYATVSYSWGASTHSRLKTQAHDPSRPDLTIASHQAGIDIGRFPRTLQGAIHIAQHLKFDFLWIDSVCIIQDDDDDWATQSAAMTQIYAQSRLNISASSSEHSDWGILGRATAQAVRVGRVVFTNDDGGGYETQDLYVGLPLPALDLEDKYLASRGWVFQERLVSPATLHYTDEGMVWECAEGIQMAQDQSYHNIAWKKQWRDVLNAASALAPDAFTSDKQHQGETATVRDAILRSWYEWVSAYSERQLYDRLDRFPAVAGMAQTLSLTFNLTYAAGLWQQDLVRGILWKRFNRTETLLRYQGDPTPSWSWASVQGRLTYVDIRVKESCKAPNLEVLGAAEVEEVLPGTYGKVRSGGRIRLKGMLQEVLVDKSWHPGVRTRAWEEVGVKAGFCSAVNVLVTLDVPDVAVQEDYRCWCLRVASFDDGGREGDVFLLLDRIADADHGHADTFRRVGLVETDAWHNRLSVTPDSGKLVAADLREIMLV
ncbi:hypothetical protein CLAIMM_11102 [Cladophialophora immunda]|nr:hypothetical protein CLAIMM_11102 [Cladophialophora immunda]